MVVTVVAVRVTMGVPLRSADGGCRWAVACVLVLAAWELRRAELGGDVWGDTRA